ncbi:MAG: PDZ domain-containing protein [Rhodopila sp.]
MTRMGAGTKRLRAMALAAILILGEAGVAVRAENAMGYQLLSEQEASSLPRNHGALGIDVSRAQQITDSGMTFDIMQVTAVKQGSPGASAGFRRGDQIIAVNGRLFPSLRAFAAYVGSMQPGTLTTIDYMPAGLGPEQARRAAVRVGGGFQRPPPQTEERQQNAGGLSMGTKLAIGAGAVALFGCYKFGCFSHKSSQPSEGR